MLSQRNIQMSSDSLTVVEVDKEDDKEVVR